MMEIKQKEFIYPLEGRPTESCHASTLIKTDCGDIIAAWFGGTREKANDVNIWSARRHNGVWSQPVRMSEALDIACWNPVLFNAGQAIHLYFKRGREISGWRTMIKHSYDGGLTWTPERELVENDDSGGRGPVKNKPIRLSDGSILAPASTENEDGSLWDPFVDRSDDNGTTWRRSDFIQANTYARMIQPTLWESSAGVVHMLLRSAAGWIYRSDSEDNGRTWCPAYPTALTNNNSGIDAVLTDSGVLALVCNIPVDNPRARTPINLLLSSDNGKSWREDILLETGEGEYSYPAIIYSEGKLHITFTWRRQTIMYCEVSIT